MNTSTANDGHRAALRICSVVSRIYLEVKFCRQCNRITGNGKGRAMRCRTWIRVAVPTPHVSKSQNVQAAAAAAADAVTAAAAVAAAKRVFIYAPRMYGI